MLPGEVGGAMRVVVVAEVVVVAAGAAVVADDRGRLGCPLLAVVLVLPGNSRSCFISTLTGC